MKRLEFVAGEKKINKYILHTYMNLAGEKKINKYILHTYMNYVIKYCLF